MFTVGLSILAGVFVVTIGALAISNLRFDKQPKMYSNGHETKALPEGTMKEDNYVSSQPDRTDALAVETDDPLMAAVINDVMRSGQTVIVNREDDDQVSVHRS